MDGIGIELTAPEEPVERRCRVEATMMVTTDKLQPDLCWLPW